MFPTGCIKRRAKNIRYFSWTVSLRNGEQNTPNRLVSKKQQGRPVRLFPVSTWHEVRVLIYTTSEARMTMAWRDKLYLKPLSQTPLFVQFWGLHKNWVVSFSRYGRRLTRLYRKTVETVAEARLLFSTISPAVYDRQFQPAAQNRRGLSYCLYSAGIHSFGLCTLESYIVVNTPADSP